MQKLLGLLLAMSSAVILVGCEMMMETAAINPPRDIVPENFWREQAKQMACESFEKISWSVNDTDQTIIEVKEHDRVYECMCEQPQPEEKCNPREP